MIWVAWGMLSISAPQTGHSALNNSATRLDHRQEIWSPAGSWPRWTLRGTLQWSVSSVPTAAEGSQQPEGIYRIGLHGLIQVLPNSSVSYPRLWCIWVSFCKDHLHCQTTSFPCCHNEFERKKTILPAAIALCTSRSGFSTDLNHVPAENHFLTLLGLNVSRSWDHICSGHKTRMGCSTPAPQQHISKTLCLLSNH